MPEPKPAKRMSPMDAAVVILKDSGEPMDHPRDSKAGRRERVLDSDRLQDAFFALVAKWYASVLANPGRKLSSKSEGVKSPSKSEKVRGFPDFRDRDGFHVSKTALRKARSRANFEGKRQGKAGRK